MNPITACFWTCMVSIALMACLMVMSIWGVVDGDVFWRCIGTLGVLIAASGAAGAVLKYFNK